MKVLAPGTKRLIASNPTYSGSDVACLFTAGAVVLTLCTAMPKLPETAAVQPGGGGDGGEMSAVTP